MAAELGHLARGAAAILCLLISHVAASDSRAQARISGRTRTCISREQDALLSFKAGLLDPAGRLSSWYGEDCCQWEGVRCSSRTGHVVKLNLHNTYMPDYDAFIYGYARDNSLSLSRDEMSSSLAALRHLRYLDLSGNDFNGTSIPVFVGSLENLRYLNLSSSGFGGRIPSQLCNLSKLQYLDLSGNDFNGTSIPVSVGSLENLRYLDLSSSSFGGRIPSQLGNLSKLQYLDVGENYYFGSNYSKKLHAVDLAWLERLQSLSNLDMSDVDLSPVHDWVYMVNMLSSLRVLLLEHCRLTSTASVASQSNLTHLQVLDLSFNPFITSLEHSWFWDLTSLKEFYLESCYQHGYIPEELGHMTSLEVIAFSQNNLVALIPSNLQNLCSLEVLYFERDQH